MHLIVQIPFEELVGKVYRSPMPYGPFDEYQQIYPKIRRLNVSTIVMLTSDEEAIQLSGHDLRRLYQQDKIEVIHLPINDFEIPMPGVLEQTVQNTIQLAQQGRNIVIHCSAGCGRTGLFLVELTKAIKGLSGEQAIQYARKWVPCAIESEAQKAFVLRQSDANDAAS